VIVIGSGATAATLVPAIADAVSHVTILQRSPTYYFTGENRNLLADHLRELEVPEEWVHDIVRREEPLQPARAHAARARRAGVRQGGAHRFGARRAATGFRRGDALHAALHAWRQRNRVPTDGDLFKSISDGQASSSSPL